MICLTGDIHHSSLKTNDQKYLLTKTPKDSEIKIAVKFLNIIEKYGLKVTFYVTGKTLAEEWADFKIISESEFVEIGGHTYSGIPLSVFNRIKYRLKGLTPPSHSTEYGSEHYQNKDIKKVKDIINKRTGQELLSWRSHGLIYDDKTYQILYKHGIKFISDEISSTKFFPEKLKEGLISHPINTIPDHDHIYHAHRNREFCNKAKKRGYGTDDFGPNDYTIEEWGELVKRQVIDIESKYGIATLLIHPLCQYLSDEFETVEKLFKLFSGFKTIWAKEIINSN